MAAYAPVARADDVPVLLDWKVPSGEHCPSADDVMLQVSKLIGSKRAAERASIRARADVRKLDDGRFRVELTTLTDESEGHRVIEERSCQAMAEATAVILAWMVDPNAVDASERGEASKLQVVAAPAKPPQRKRRGTELLAGVRGAFDLGTLPAFGAGAGLEYGLGWPPFRILFHGDLWGDQTSYVAQRSGAAAPGARFALVVLGFDACFLPLAWDIAACAGPEVDRLFGTGFGVDAPRTNSATWLSFGVGVDGRTRLVGPVGIAGSLRLIVPTRRETFGLDGIGDVHRVGAIAGRAAVGLDAQF